MLERALVGLLITGSYSASHMYANKATLATGMVTMICSFHCATTSVVHVLGLHKARAGKDKYSDQSNLLHLFSICYKKQNFWKASVQRYPMPASA